MTRAQATAVTTEAAHAAMICAMAASSQEVTATRERLTVFIKEVEARVTVAERGARDSVASVAYICGEADEAVRKVAFLEGELANAR
jgi:hypothetical protein